MTVKEAFENLYHRPPQDVAFTPYRVCPIGAHVDHQLGKISGFAIDKGIYMAYGPKQNGVVELSSLQFEGRAQWHVAGTPEQKQDDWADHLRGATIALNQRYPLRTGLCAVVCGELPIGGLSSSAAVIITFLSALASVNGITLSAEKMIEIALEAENGYVGVACGKLDQSCEIYCRRDHLLFMDMKDGAYQRIPTPANMKPYKIAIFFSGLERSLASSKFNVRVDECRAAAYALLSYAGMDYGKLSQTSLRDVPREVYEAHRHQLPDAWRRRADHYFSEIERVELGAEAWQRGDIEAFGKQIFASGYSSIYNYETGSDELKALYEIMLDTEGIYGGRFSGAGFKGCCMALIDPAYEESIKNTVTQRYLAIFPHLSDKFSVHFCNTADGVQL